MCTDVFSSILPYIILHKVCKFMYLYGKKEIERKEKERYLVMNQSEYAYNKKKKWYEKGIKDNLFPYIFVLVFFWQIFSCFL